MISSEHQPTAIKDLNRPFESLKMTANGAPARLIGLIGRDFLRHARFVYNGPLGEYEVYLDSTLLK